MSRKTTPTYVLLNQITLAAASSSVTFSNIPQNYGDLVLVVDGTANSLRSLLLNFNSDSSSSYSYVLAYGNGSTTLSLNGTAGSITQGALDTSQTNNIYQIMDYSATDKHKTVLIRYNSGATSLQMSAERWAKTEGIHTILCTISNGVANIGTTFSLYGLVA